MTPQEINERIAKLCGLEMKPITYVSHDDCTSERFEYTRLQWCSEDGCRIEAAPPNYYNSIDACATFESCLTGDDRSLYMDHVYLLIVRSNNKAVMGFENQWAMFNATPAQRCEAFLRMKGQWE